MMMNKITILYIFGDKVWTFLYSTNTLSFKNSLFSTTLPCIIPFSIKYLKFQSQLMRGRVFIYRNKSYNLTKNKQKISFANKSLKMDRLFNLFIITSMLFKI